MTETLLSEFLKISLVTGLLAYIAYILWKKVDSRIKSTEEELKELRNRYENELLADRIELKLLVRDNNIAVGEVKAAVTGFQTLVETLTKVNHSMLNRTGNIMECLTKEIKRIKPELNVHQAYKKENPQPIRTEGLVYVKVNSCVK